MDITSINFINVPPNSVLLIQVPGPLIPEQAAAFRDAIMAKGLPNIRDVLILPDTCKLSIVEASDVSRLNRLFPRMFGLQNG